MTFFIFNKKLKCEKNFVTMFKIKEMVKNILKNLYSVNYILNPF